MEINTLKLLIIFTLDLTPNFTLQIWIVITQKFKIL